MNYIGLLTKEEKSTLCEIITGKEFKELFKRNEQEFSKIQKGFRAKSLTEQHALLIAITHIDNPFIAMWVNMRVEHWLKEIEENIAKLEGEGLSHGAALATTMLDSCRLCILGFCTINSVLRLLQNLSHNIRGNGWKTAAQHLQNGRLPNGVHHHRLPSLFLFSCAIPPFQHSLYHLDFHKACKISSKFGIAGMLSIKFLLLLYGI